jgi:hypothetical protein
MIPNNNGYKKQIHYRKHLIDADTTCVCCGSPVRHGIACRIAQVLISKCRGKMVVGLSRNLMDRYRRFLWYTRHNIACVATPSASFEYFSLSGPRRLSCPTSYFTAISFNHIAIVPTTALPACPICWQHWFPTLGVICSNGGYWYPVGVGIRYERLDCESESKKSDDTDHYQHSGHSRSAVVRVIRVGHVDERCR